MVPGYNRSETVLYLVRFHFFYQSLIVLMKRTTEREPTGIRWNFTQNQINQDNETKRLHVNAEQDSLKISTKKP